MEENNNYTLSPSTTNIKRFSICLPDEEDANIKEHFVSVHKFLEGAFILKKEKEKEEDNTSSSILLHCVMGFSRSPTLLASWLMKQFHLSSTDAIEYLAKYRAIDPNSGFLSQLKSYQKEINNNNK